MSTPAPKKPSTKASKKASNAPIIKETIQAPHVFTDVETAVMNLKLRDHLDSIEALQGDAKAAAQDFKLRMTNHVNETKMLRTKLSAGQENRETQAIVTFNAKAREKTYTHPVTKQEIRKEPMTAIDFQLPMFKPVDGKEVVAKKGEPDAPASGEKPKALKGDLKTKVTETDPKHGQTPVGAALNDAAANSEAAKVPFNMDTAVSMDHITLSKLFLKEAKRVGWTAVQLGAIKDLFGNCSNEEQYLNVIRPHVSDPASN